MNHPGTAAFLDIATAELACARLVRVTDAFTDSATCSTIIGSSEFTSAADSWRTASAIAPSWGMHGSQLVPDDLLDAFDEEGCEGVCPRAQPALSCRAAASAVSSGRVLKAIAAFGAALWMMFTTFSNNARLWGGSLRPPPITTQS